MVLPFKNELCPFDLAPTTSSIIQLIFGDVLAAALMRKKQFTLDAYALNHPAGQIGKRTKLKVSDLMIKGDQLPLCHPEEKLASVLDLMSQKRCGCLVVVDQNRQLQGVFTDGDLRRSLQNHKGNVMDTPIGDLMTKGGRFIESSASAWDAMRKMEEDHQKPIMILPVIDQDQVQGLIKMHDLVQSGL
jgi:arabinose-5-phosphate isomerase